jgi:hypothetical protein
MFRSRPAMMAAVFVLGLVGCAGSSQSGLNPSASGQALQPAALNSSVHKATGGFVWRSSHFDISAGHIGTQVLFCKPGAMALNGGYRTRGIGPDVTILDSHPVTGNDGWVIRAKNNGQKTEFTENFLLCTA